MNPYRFKILSYFPLISIIIVSICAVIFGCKGGDAIIEEKKDWFRQFLDFP
ncbi:conserved protein of unknown function [Xenorhabdus poinarii G6]|uniref:Lipoprotein n=1 Tax=Xenorhabdus poinarii G6 TaxID=1354304 RepID=A0A068R367_9GAMM|nr:conserved protein of unknown function [Xenorhabdus poinarii G6]